MNRAVLAVYSGSETLHTMNRAVLDVYSGSETLHTVNRAVLAVYSGSETLQACSLLSLQWTWSYSALPRTHRLRSSHTRMCAFHAADPNVYRVF